MAVCMPTDTSQRRMVHMLVICMLVHGMAAMRESDWGATVSAKDKQAAVNFRGDLHWCDCWNTTEQEEEEEKEVEEVVECRCKGPDLLDVPNNLPPGVQALLLTGLGMRTLKNNSLQPYKDSLQDLTLNEMKHLERIEVGTFSGMEHLRTIYISEAPLLRVLPAGIFVGLSNRFLSLRIMRTGLESFPDLSDFSEGSIMHMIDLEANRIREIKSNSVRVKAYQLILNYNAIQSVDGWAFNGSEIAKLSLKGNRLLTRLSSEAFHGLKSLTDLDLSETAITHLPTGGLEGLDVLRIQDTESLKVIPSVYSFKHLKEAWLTYSFHCCAFKFPARHDPTKHAMHQAYLTKMRENCSKDTGQRNKRSTSHTMWMDSLSEFIHSSSDYIPTLSYKDIWDPTYEDGRSFGPISAEGYQPLRDSIPHSDQEGSDGQKWHSEAEPVKVEADSDDPTADHGTFHQTTAEVATKLQAMCGNLSASPIHVMCWPEPDALNPCEDIMGFTWLRVSVWFVVVTAVVGNLAVLLVLLSNMLEITVPKFLMCHLAFADLCMGAYLLILAVMDVHSSGVYFNFAYGWQIGVGCQVAGFLTVFASQLSIYTLSILTLERWFAITYAIYLNKRLKLRAAAQIMLGGWMYSITMAALPLFGISSYSTTSICLPMETRDVTDMAYLICLLVVNGLAFVVICICYAQIYLSLGRETRRCSSPGRFSASSAGEMTVAKKMALLVFTDFACWAPIAFFGLTAVAGYPLIDVTRSKILLVFFYPLNSCANPYLYAILTAQYRKDLFVLLARYGLCMKTAQQYKMTYSLATTNNSNPIPLVQRSMVVIVPTSTNQNGHSSVAVNSSVRTSDSQHAEIFV